MRSLHIKPFPPGKPHHPTPRRHRSQGKNTARIQRNTQTASQVQENTGKKMKKQDTKPIPGYQNRAPGETTPPSTPGTPHPGKKLWKDEENALICVPGAKTHRKKRKTSRWIWRAGSYLLLLNSSPVC